MGVAEDLADALAKDVIAAAEELGDDTLIDEVAKALGQSSTTTEEAFMTSVRVRIAERRARRALETAVARRRAAGWTARPAADTETGADAASAPKPMAEPEPKPAPKRASTRKAGPRIPRPPTPPGPKLDRDQ